MFRNFTCILHCFVVFDACVLWKLGLWTRANSYLLMATLLSLRVKASFEHVLANKLESGKGFLSSNIDLMNRRTDAEKQWVSRHVERHNEARIGLGIAGQGPRQFSNLQRLVRKLRADSMCNTRFVGRSADAQKAHVPFDS